MARLNGAFIALCTCPKNSIASAGSLSILPYKASKSLLPPFFNV
jgi:hypothetical protein